MTPVHAERRKINPLFFAQHEMDLAKVQAIALHVQTGGTVPPVVAVDYGDRYMPLDGHHRMAAHQLLNMMVDAFVVPGSAFDNLEIECPADARAEDHVLCDGIPALQVAERLAA